MDNDCWSRFMTPNEVGQQGIYGLLKKLSENYANQLSPLETTKKSMLSMCYMILLKKKSIKLQEGISFREYYLFTCNILFSFVIIMMDLLFLCHFITVNEFIGTAILIHIYRFGQRLGR